MPKRKRKADRPRFDRDALPPVGVSEGAYWMYRQGYKAWLIGTSTEPPRIDRMQAIREYGLAMVEEAITRLRKSWYDGYFDARTDHFLEKIK